jgi:hypothetical protein
VEQSETKTAVVKPFKWTAQKEQAAKLVAEDTQTEQEIAAAVGIGRTTLWRCTQHLDFAARVAEIVKTLGDRALRFEIARRDRRVQALQERWTKLRQIIAEQAASPEMQGVPGGRTGLLCRTIRQIGAGENAREVEEFAVDTGLLKELREHEKLVALELHQLAVKHEDHGGGHAPVVLNIVEVVVPPADQRSPVVLDGIVEEVVTNVPIIAATGERPGAVTNVCPHGTTVPGAAVVPPQ